MLDKYFANLAKTAGAEELSLVSDQAAAIQTSISSNHLLISSSFKKCSSTGSFSTSPTRTTTTTMRTVAEKKTKGSTQKFSSLDDDSEPPSLPARTLSSDLLYSSLPNLSFDDDDDDDDSNDGQTTSTIMPLKKTESSSDTMKAMFRDMKPSSSYKNKRSTYTPDVYTTTVRDTSFTAMMPKVPVRKTSFDDLEALNENEQTLLSSSSSTTRKFQRRNSCESPSTVIVPNTPSRYLPSTTGSTRTMNCRHHRRTSFRRNSADGPAPASRWGLFF